MLLLRSWLLLYLLLLGLLLLELHIWGVGNRRKAELIPFNPGCATR
jgi:hypothetical protein